MRQNIFKLSLIIFISFSWGYFSHRNNLFPGDIIRKVFSIQYITKLKYNLLENSHENHDKPNIIRYYNTNTLIFSDRKYINKSEYDNNIKGLTLIQIPRHYDKNIKIKVLTSLVIYRALCNLNNNSYYKNWEQAEFNLKIEGTREYCTHKRVVKKLFNPQIISLPSGGPASSDPIFIDEKAVLQVNFMLD